MATLMQVRQAARRLGVHENTLRRWANKGLIQPVVLPSGVRRFRADDVDQLHRSMFSGFAPLSEQGSDIADLPPREGGRSID